MAGFAHENTVNKTVEWYTPKYIFDALGLAFDIDVCSPGLDVVPWIPAKRCYTAADDGLASLWEGKVWMNPPYGKETPIWLKKLANHGNGVALLFSRTDTKWFHDYISTAGAVCFLRGRINFINGLDFSSGKAPGAGSILIGYGEDCAFAVMRCGLGLSMRIEGAV